MILSTFRFFRGILRKVKLVQLRNRFTRTPIAHIPVPPHTATISEYRRAFINGWRSCEFGRNIYDCPHSSYDLVEIQLKREWEHGFTECFNTRQEDFVLNNTTVAQTDEQYYLEGWSTAQFGLPLNENPHTYGSNQFNMWYIGWNDFVDNH